MKNSHVKPDVRATVRKVPESLEQHVPNSSNGTTLCEYSQSLMKQTGDAQSLNCMHSSRVFFQHMTQMRQIP